MSNEIATNDRAGYKITTFAGANPKAGLSVQLTTGTKGYVSDRVYTHMDEQELALLIKDLKKAQKYIKQVNQQ